MTMNLDKFRPMKSATPEQDFDFSTLFTGPQGEERTWYASPKLDGIRCVNLPGLGARSNTLLPIRNNFIRTWIEQYAPPYLDGELVVGTWKDPANFQATTSGVMSIEGNPDFRFCVFDHFEAGDMCGFGIRQGDLERTVEQAKQRFWSEHATAWRIEIVTQNLLSSYEELQEYEEFTLAAGYEGVMLRSPGGKYKKGRSTLLQGGMIKIKRFVDAEAQIIGWEPLRLNENEPTISAQGLQKRGSSKDGKVIDDTRVGRFRCKGINGRFKGVEFWCGSGLDDARRTKFREQLRTYNINPWPSTYQAAIEQGLFGDNNPMGKFITYKYQDFGSKDAPRTPIWKGIRHPNDISS